MQLVLEREGLMRESEDEAGETWLRKKGFDRFEAPCWQMRLGIVEEGGGWFGVE